MNKKTPSKAKQAFIATLDIMGVTRIMLDAKACELQQIGDSIYNAFVDVKKSLEQGCLPCKLNPEPLKHTKANSFSDTIVLSCAFNGTESDADRCNQTNAFFLKTMFAIHHMFRIGLPVRCGIDYGYTYRTKDIVVGLPCVNSFILSESLEFSGAILTDNAFKAYQEFVPSHRQFVNFYNIKMPSKTPKKKNHQ
jgi:hypothetical protein